jgi:uncharacterized protein (TIGR02996 family)
MHSDEAAFLAHIRTDPDDDTVRLAFADWLEKRGDSRGAWVRIRGLWEWMQPDAADPIPRLIRALGTSDSDDRSGVACVLSWIGEAAVPALIAALQDDDEQRRSGAADALGRLAPVAPAAVPHLISALRDGEYCVISSAVWALMKFGPAVAVPALLDVLRDGDPEVQCESAMALGRVGSSEAVTQLIEAMRAQNDDVRECAAGAISLSGPAAAPAVPALVQALRDGCDRVRIAAARTLGQIGPAASSAVPNLGRLVLRDENWLVRCTTTETLGKFDAAAVPHLIAALEDLDYRVRTVAAEQLGNIGPTAEAAIPGLIAAVRDDYQTRSAAEVALVNVGKAAVPYLTALLQYNEDRVCRGAARALAQLGAASYSVVPHLIAGLREHGEWFESLSALERTGAAAVPALIALLRDNASEVRRRAVWALERIGAAATPAIPVLEQTLLDECGHVRDAAAEALQVLKAGNPAAPPL